MPTGLRQYDPERGYVTTENYRELYKLRHVRALREELQSRPEAASDEKNITASLMELFDRAEAMLDALEKAGKAAGMLEGDSVGEKAADDLNLALGIAASKSYNFLAGLRECKLAPDNGSYSGEVRFYEAYSLEHCSSSKILIRIGGRRPGRPASP